MLNGAAVVTAAVCNAVSPPVSSSTAATAPIITAPSPRRYAGGSGSPPAVRMLTTSEPESAEVTKKIAITTIAVIVMSMLRGSCSKSTKITVAISACTASTRPASPASSKLIAVLPNTTIQKNVVSDGASSTPAMNSRIVRPREIRAINIPTNGDQLIHQPQ